MPRGAPTTPDPELTITDRWEQQADEGPEAYEAFSVYRDLGRGSRSLREVAQTLGKSQKLMGDWSGRHQWVNRVGAYDRHLDDLRRHESEEQAVRMSKRQGQHLEAAAQALIAPVQELLKRITAARSRDEDPFKGMDTPALARLAAVAARHVPGIVEAERLVAGLSTENVNPNAPSSVDELRQAADRKSRGELEEFLLGVDDGRAALAAELGVTLDEAGRPVDGVSVDEVPAQ